MKKKERMKNIFFFVILKSLKKERKKERKKEKGRKEK